MPPEQCHYVGSVRGLRRSRAALSLCGEGLRGVVDDGRSRFYVQPAAGAEPDAQGRHVHVAFRDPDDAHGADSPGPARGDRECVAGGDWRSAWEQRLRESLAQQPPRHPRATLPRTKDTRWIEVAAFCDPSFVKYHAGQDVDAYVLTLFNIAANLFHDASLGRAFHVVLVRIVYIDNAADARALRVSSDAEGSLERFNRWAMRANPPADHPNHHDVAFLLTKNELCSAEGSKRRPRCQAVGVASTAQGCSHAKSGCIAEDAGLLTGTAIAHLLGHQLGCAHDSTAAGDSGCPERLADGSAVVMAPPAGHARAWSACSRAAVAAFVRSGLGACLADEPLDAPYERRAVDMLPGALYGADYQCWDMLETHAPTRKCPIFQEKFCEELWCLVGSSCVSFRQPAADGTPCGFGKWCYGGACVALGARPGAVDGGWGPWTTWSSCSRSCGGGTQTRERTCTQPAPERGGFYCPGARTEHRVCNPGACPTGAPSYRQVQCAAFDARPFKGQLHRWRDSAARESDEPCALVCRAESGLVAKLSKCVKDGTPCRKGTRDLCVECECERVDCAWVIGGSAVQDACGVCNGTGANCKRVDDFFNASSSVIQYATLTVVPKGSYRVDIEEKEPSSNEIAIASPDRQKWYLHGKNTADQPGEIKFGSDTGVFTTPDKNREVIFIRGPTKEDLAILYNFKGGSPRNPGVSVKYHVPTTGARAPQYAWDFVTWSACPVVCGGATQLSYPDCVEKSSGKVTAALCGGALKPMPMSRKCNPQACRVGWHPGPWSACSGCDGKTGAQTRRVTCAQQNPNPKEPPIRLDATKCHNEKRPLARRECIGNTPCTTPVAHHNPPKHGNVLTHVIGKHKSSAVKTTLNRHSDTFSSLKKVSKLKGDFVVKQYVDQNKKDVNLDIDIQPIGFAATGNFSGVLDKERHGFDNSEKITTTSPSSVSSFKIKPTSNTHLQDVKDREEQSNNDIRSGKEVKSTGRHQDDLQEKLETHSVSRDAEEKSASEMEGQMREEAKANRKNEAKEEMSGKMKGQVQCEAKRRQKVEAKGENKGSALFETKGQVKSRVNVRQSQTLGEAKGETLSLAKDGAHNLAMDEPLGLEEGEVRDLEKGKKKGEVMILAKGQSDGDERGKGQIVAKGVTKNKEKSLTHSHPNSEAQIQSKDLRKGEVKGKSQSLAKSQAAGRHSLAKPHANFGAQHLAKVRTKGLAKGQAKGSTESLVESSVNGPGMDEAQIFFKGSAYSLGKPEAQSISKTHAKDRAAADFHPLKALRAWSHTHPFTRPHTRTPPHTHLPAHPHTHGGVVADAYPETFAHLRVAPLVAEVAAGNGSRAGADDEAGEAVLDTRRMHEYSGRAAEQRFQRLQQQVEREAQGTTPADH